MISEPMKTLLFGLFASTALLGCSGPSGEHDNVGLTSHRPLAHRHGAVVVDGCALDTWQTGALASSATKRLVSEVIFLCLVPRATGEVGPSDPSAVANLAATVNVLHDEGYRVKLAVSFTDETGRKYDGVQTAAHLADPVWTKTVIANLKTASNIADGLELDLQRLPSTASAFVTSFTTDLAAAIRPGRELGMFLPPSIQTPSDVVGGDAFALDALAPLLDHARVMTLDFSCCNQTPGPTIDPGWAVDAVRFAAARMPKARIDVAFPLYGTDFGPNGQRAVSFLEASAVANARHAPLERGPTGALQFTYRDDTGDHAVWFDDAESTARALSGWDATTLPLEVGIVFYGLGSEDPALFDALSSRTP
jgi:spore germination protein YaaH